MTLPPSSPAQRNGLKVMAREPATALQSGHSAGPYSYVLPH
jgi:hypothetical protein